MSRDQAEEIAVDGVTVDVGDATTRYLLYGLLPGWFVPGLAEWAMHRRTRIEETAGTEESVIRSVMTAEVGIPVALTLRHEVGPLLLSVQPGGVLAHQATAPASLMCLHADQVRSLLRAGYGDTDAWRLVPRRRPQSRGCLAGIAAATGTCVLLPYDEELLRCRRAARRERKRANDKARRRATKGR